MLRDGRYIRKLYKDPITDEDFQPVYLGQIAGGTTPTNPIGPAGARGQQPAGRPGGPPAARGRVGQPPFGGAQGAAASGPIIGVASRSTAASIRQYNGRGRYNEWAFVSTAATRQAGSPTQTQTPGADGRGGRGGRQAAPGLPGRGGPNRGFPGRMMPLPPRGIGPNRP
jgi:hypothetical protein